MSYTWPTLELSTPNGARATVLEYGAHLTHWHTSAQKPWIFLSESAKFELGQPIRGGVPLVFPQFNNRGSGPKHGFLRNNIWQSVSTTETEGHIHECLLEFPSNTETLKLWPHHFLAQFKVQLTDHSLKMSLSIKNTDKKPFEFNSALHTYFAINQLQQTQVSGLSGKQYWDNGTPLTQRTHFDEQSLELSDAIDRVFFDTDTTLSLADHKHTLQIEHTDFKDTVVWNPGTEGVKDIGDLDNQEYSKMLCVEAANIQHPVVLAPGQVWTGVQNLRQLA